MGRFDMTKIFWFNSVKKHKFCINSVYIWPSIVVVIKTSSADEIISRGQLIYEYKEVDEITGKAGNFTHPGSIIKSGSRCWKRPKKAFSLTLYLKKYLTFRDF
jgi:hypothetical protein